MTLADAERGGSCTVSTLEPSTSRLPQSASGMTTFADAVISCPSTVRPVSDDAATFADAFAAPAATLARTSSESTVISPAKSETANAPTPLCALDETPGWAVDAASAEPIRTIEPSSG